MDILYSNELHEQYLERTLTSAQRVVPLIHELVRPASVVDVGCGHGYWLREFEKQGVRDVRGVDGEYVDRGKLVIHPDSFSSIDLNDPMRSERVFDLAISLEVGEHLRPESGPRFIEYLVSCSSCVLFSAAIPGQPGNDHRNPRWPKYWKDQFESRGYIVLDPVRPRIWHEEQVMLCYRQNILLMVREDRYKADQSLQALPKANCLMLIDEEALAHYVSPNECLKRLFTLGPK